MKIVCILTITCLISFVGSIHPGSLNMAVIQTALKYGKRRAASMIIGGVLPEILYAWLAVEGVQFFEKSPMLYLIINWVCVGLFLTLGIFAWFTAGKTNTQSEINQPNGASFIKGFLLSLFNPQLLPFWLVIVVHYQAYHLLHIQHSVEQICFALGACIGALLLNTLYVKIAFKQRQLIFHYIAPQTFDRCISLGFLGMAGMQLYKIL